MKLSLLGLSVLAIGAAACVTDDGTTTSARVLDDAVAPINVIDEVEIPGAGPIHADPAVVVITGIDWPGRAPTHPNIDVSNIDELTLDVDARAVCGLVSDLPSTDVCSTLCDPDAFAARVFAGGENGCTQQTCQLPGGTAVTVDVCN